MGNSDPHWGTEIADWWLCDEGAWGGKYPCLYSGRGVSSLKEGNSGIKRCSHHNEALVDHPEFNGMERSAVVKILRERYKGETP
jgi:hypothetical protein